jgi:hypothetical protein
MTHSDATFEKIGRSAKPLYGPKKLLLCGFSRAAQETFSAVLEAAGLADIAKVWASESSAEDRLADLMEQADGTGRNAPSGLPRAVIVGGITETQLRALMTAAKKSGVGSTLWAVLTPTSETWTLKRLLAELSAERRAMQK